MICKFFLGELFKEEHVHIARLTGIPLFRKLAARLGLTSCELKCLENEVMCLDVYYMDK